MDGDRQSWPTRLAGLAGAGTIRAWMSTLEYQAAFYDPSVDPALGEPAGRSRIYLFWHENILFPIYLRGHCHLTMLLSRHHDANVLSVIAQLLGFQFVRGSTYGGGIAAIRELVERSRGNHITITPDGPRGPRRVLAQGAIYLASKLGLPIVAMGFGYDRPWRIKSWDRFAVPRPFSRARAVISPEILIPPRLDRTGVEHYRARVEELLNRLTLEAEAWAEAGTRKIGGVPLRREVAPRHALVLKSTPTAGAFRTSRRAG